MTKKQEREERKRRRMLKKSDIEQRRTERRVRREKREMAKAYSAELTLKAGRLPTAPYCEICNERHWCIHNYQKAQRGEK